MLTGDGQKTPDFEGAVNSFAAAVMDSDGAEGDEGTERIERPVVGDEPAPARSDPPLAVIGPTVSDMRKMSEAAPTQAARGGEGDCAAKLKADCQLVGFALLSASTSTALDDRTRVLLRLAPVCS